ncbi:MAG: hypothetical protein LBH73_03885 [Spirochaetaceae bacterium]|nr:hypothetical protein [Spirochaetaceae bacterium]
MNHSDIAVLCALLKPMEERLNARERSVLLLLERELYSRLSIGEAAKLLDGKGPKQGER